MPPKGDEGWAFAEGQSLVWVCDRLSDDSPGCAKGPGLKDIEKRGLRGMVRRLPDGRHYLEGFDCFAPSAEYDGAAVPCGTSTEGLPGAPMPRLWLTKFSVTSQRLRFEAESRGTNFKYYIRVQAPLIPL